MDRVAPHLRVASVTISSSRPRALARFYALLLSWHLVAEELPQGDEPPDAGLAQVRPPAGTPGPTLNFEHDPHFTRPVWPSELG